MTRRFVVDAAELIDFVKKTSRIDPVAATNKVEVWLATHAAPVSKVESAKKTCGVQHNWVLDKLGLNYVCADCGRSR